MFVERETSQFAGFMNPLVKCLMNAHKIKDFSEEEFNVNSDTYFFLRESHEDNRKKRLVSQPEMGRCIIVWELFPILLKNILMTEFVPLKLKFFSSCMF